jgi:hypothetical protein
VLGGVKFAKKPFNNNNNNNNNDNNNNNNNKVKAKSQTLEGYISRDIYILSYIQKCPKRIFPILFLTFSARDFGFQRQDFFFSSAVTLCLPFLL